MLATSGSFCMWTSAGGWSSMFYTFGSAAVLFCLLWMFCVYDSPGEHPRISESERSYILENISSQPTRTVSTGTGLCMIDYRVHCFIAGSLCYSLNLSETKLGGCQ